MINVKEADIVLVGVGVKVQVVVNEK